MPEGALPFLFNPKFFLFLYKTIIYETIKSTFRPFTNTQLYGYYSMFFLSVFPDKMWRYNINVCQRN
ncbi:conserved protein of unknown function [Chryseobacterium sp. JV274]|nr:conserved protein of unknown function [Chryseobacterium sp. JV274]